MKIEIDDTMCPNLLCDLLLWLGKQEYAVQVPLIDGKKREGIFAATSSEVIAGRTPDDIELKDLELVLVRPSRVRLSIPASAIRSIKF